MNVFDFAIEMEDSGCEYYTGLAKTATLPGLKTVFTSMAEDERKHSEFFRSLKMGNQDLNLPEASSLITAQNVFSFLPRDEEALKGMTDVLQAYTHGMKLEADSFKFYQDAASKEDNLEVKALILKIASEEQEHFNILENLFNFVNAPNQSLEWAEFSNLGEFSQFGRD